jgi:hypothetical protein
LKQRKQKLPQPKRQRGVELCIAVRKGGVSLYGNPKALKTLAEWLSWIASASASERYHFHVPWHLENTFRKPTTPSNIWFLFDRRMSRAVGKPKKDELGFDVQFMAVTKADLARLRKRQSSGLVPNDWSA